MKLRFDFVSNSSSSSFILRGEYAAKGIRLLKRIVESCEVPWEVENEIVLHVHALNKNMPALSRLLDDDYDNYGRYTSRYGYENSNPPDERSWHSIEVPLSESGLSKLTDEALEKIDDVEFYLSDGHTLTLVLKLLYIFFQKKKRMLPRRVRHRAEFHVPGMQRRLHVRVGVRHPDGGKGGRK